MVVSLTQLWTLLFERSPAMSEAPAAHEFTEICNVEVRAHPTQGDALVGETPPDDWSATTEFLRIDWWAIYRDGETGVLYRVRCTDRP